MKLTKRTIDDLKPPSSGDRYFWDDEVPGFGLRMKPSGIRSFVVQYRNAGGTSRRITLGRYGILTAEEARKLAKAKLAEAAKGGDPAAERAEARKAMTVRQVCEAYLDAAARGHKHGAEWRTRPSACRRPAHRALACRSQPPSGFWRRTRPPDYRAR